MRRSRNVEPKMNKLNRRVGRPPNLLAEFAFLQTAHKVSEPMRTKISWLSVLIVAAIVVGLLASVWYPYRKAQHIRTKLQSIDWVHYSNEDVRHFAAEFGGTFTCEKDWCEAEIRVANRMLSSFRLAPLTDFRALVHTRSNHVTNFSVTLTNAGTGASSIMVAKTFEPDGLAIEGERYVVDRGRGHKAPFVTVRIPANATRQQGVPLDNLELKCLRRVGGCSMQELGPGIWNLVN
jgi:hypothetical protein